MYQCIADGDAALGAREGRDAQTAGRVAARLLVPKAQVRLLPPPAFPTGDLGYRGIRGAVG